MHWRIDLMVGSTFVFKGDYCIVTKMRKKIFEYDIQNSPVKGYMSYSYYMTIPSFKAKQRNFNKNKINKEINFKK
jgi:hypothetical protein